MTKLDHIFNERYELEEMINTIGNKANNLVELLKRKSSEEVLNGSLEEARNIITQILPIENEYRQLIDAQKSFLQALSNNKTLNLSAKTDDFQEIEESQEPKELQELKNLRDLEDSKDLEDLEDLEESQEIENFREIEESQELENLRDFEESEDIKGLELSKLDLSDMDFTPNDSYRIPILKALIYLGGSAKLEDVAAFIEKDMKNKFKEADQEKGANGFGKLWIEMVNREKENLLIEGLIYQDTINEKWEIVQNGIEYLSQNTN